MAGPGPRGWGDAIYSQAASCVLDSCQRAGLPRCRAVGARHCSVNGGGIRRFLPGLARARSRRWLSGFCAGRLWYRNGSRELATRSKGRRLTNGFGAGCASSERAARARPGLVRWPAIYRSASGAPGACGFKSTSAGEKRRAFSRWRGLVRVSGRNKAISAAIRVARGSRGAISRRAGCLLRGGNPSRQAVAPAPDELGALPHCVRFSVSWRVGQIVREQVTADVVSILVVGQRRHSSALAPP